MQEQILAKRIELYVIDAGRIARDAGLAGRTNTVLQTCFFAISGVLEREQAIERIKASIAKTYGRRGAEVVERNQRAVDHALDGLHRVELPERVTADARAAAARARRTRPSSCATVTAAMMAGRGDELPVSALPVDGTYPERHDRATRSATSPTWSPSGTPTCASSAATAASSARTA